MIVTSTERAAFVTGAGSGIGRATAILLLERGWHVIAADLDADALAMLNSERSDPRLTIRTVDITDHDTIATAANSCAETPVPLQAVINCAGIGSIQPLTETTPSMMRRLYEVNVIGQFMVVQSLLPCLQEDGGGGAVVNVTSVSGLTGSVGAAYGTAKGVW